MSQITLPLDIKSLEVVSQRIDSEGNIDFEVKSKNDHSTCHGFSAVKTIFQRLFLDFQGFEIYA
jgi:hypothetical protein